jgi:myo-inositol-1(or 4)-monophosphatase
VACHVASGRSQLETALVGTGFSYRRENRVVQAAMLAHLLPRIRDIRRIGSAALDLCWVANGRFDAYFESGTHYWDWAAGSVVCQEAGGLISMLPGDIVLASTPELLAPLTDLLADAHAEAQAAGLS